ncbi:MAG: hypothetical protein U0H60_05595, partial [Lachnospiraceae bacterium]|nr:hypothetical protein [Lachnospiraceae bacterium]
AIDRIIGIPIWAISLFTGISFILLLSAIFLTPFFLAQKKCAPCHISWTYADTLHTFSWRYSFLQNENE